MICVLTLFIIQGSIFTRGIHVVARMMRLRYVSHENFVNTLGMPALIAGVGSAVVAALATPEKYGSSLYKVFPSMAPKHNESLCLQFLDENKKPYFGLG